MAKRLNSEIKLNENGFKIKIGTTNRLNPSTVYMDIGGFIIPQFEAEEYKDDYEFIEHNIHKTIKKLLKENSDFEKNYICVVEIPYERMKMNKSSYLSCQCHLKQKNNLQTDEIISATKDITKELVTTLSNTLTESGFSIK